MPSRLGWKNLLANADSPSEEDIEYDVSGAFDTSFKAQHIPTNVDFVPADPPLSFNAGAWKTALGGVANILNGLYGMTVFQPTGQFAAKTVEMPLYETMTLVSTAVIDALHKAGK